jgi:DmsE family decaheme c-type cytochrome
LGLALSLWLAPGAWGEEYVGDETCIGCHTDSLEGYAHTSHAKALRPETGRTPLMKRGCESCHGPGEAHARSGGRESGTHWLSFAEEGPDARKRQDETCLQCHQGGTQRYWFGSAHESRDLSCADCHAVKKPASEHQLLSRPSEQALCTQCHPMSRAEGMRSSHMPTRRTTGSLGGEDFMSCGSCHNPHGSIADSLIAAHTVNDNCYSCHADKRGPFLWEHAPVSESCLNCHVAHGSLRPNMLRASGPRLCQSSHIEVLHVSEARRSQSRFVVGKNCLNCHQQVHGSNHPSGSFLTR